MAWFSLGEPAMHFEIRRADALWAWVLLNEADETIAESDQTYPSAAQASAAALASVMLAIALFVIVVLDIVQRRVSRRG